MRGDLESETFKDLGPLGEIGNGAFATVYSSIHRQTQVKVAVKHIQKANLEGICGVRNLRREIDIMRMMDHPFIIKLFAVYETETSFYMLMEHASNGTLLERINTNTKIPVFEAQNILIQLLSVVQYMHQEKSVVHRDIKLENILFDSKWNVRLVDFGLSSFIEPTGAQFRSICGSYPYAAPEIFSREPYTESVDIWSLGVCFYAMLVGRLPFVDSNVKRLIAKIQISDPVYPKELPEDAVDLLKAMLNKDPKTRISISDIYNHQFICKNKQKIFLTERFLHCEAYQTAPKPNVNVDEKIVSEIGASGLDPKRIFSDQSRESLYYLVSRREIVSQSIFSLIRDQFKVLFAKENSTPTFKSTKKIQKDSSKSKSLNKVLDSIDTIPENPTHQLSNLPKLRVNHKPNEKICSITTKKRLYKLI